MTGLYKSLCRCLPLAFMAYASGSYGYQNIIWTSSSIKPNVKITPFTKNSFLSTISIVPVTGTQVMQVAAVDCETEVNQRKSVTQWLMFPYKGTIQTATGNIEWTLSDFKGNSGITKLYDASQLAGPAGYGLLAYGQTEKEDFSRSCFHAGDQINVQVGSSSLASGTLKLNPQYATPGHYDITIPLFFAVEENKRQYGFNGGNLWKQIGNYMHSGDMTATASFDLVSSCKFDTSDITLSHGVISLTSDAKKEYRSNSYPLTITCDPSSLPALKIQLLGVEPVKGKNANYIPCGQGGVCQLGLDVGDKKDLWNTTIQVKGSETIVLHSNYLPNDKPVPGPFSSSAVLRIEIL